MTDIFITSDVEPDSDSERTCGCCGKRKPFSEFYKDGASNDGTPRYRRDCKECYRISRLKAKRRKR